MKTALEYFSDGYEAAAKGLPEKACPLLFSAWPRDAWLKGHAFQQEFRHAKEPKELVRVGKSPFMQGLVAYNNGIDRADCPYGVDTDEGQQWLEGWDNDQGYYCSLAFDFYDFAKLAAAATIAAGLVWALSTIW